MSVLNIEKYQEGDLVLPCVVDSIDYEKQLVLDIIQEEGNLFLVGQELSYQGVNVRVEKKLSEKPVKTESINKGGADLAKVRYYCIKK